MNQMLPVAEKELKAYFGSPMAAIFIGAFLLTALFSFFWVETFFARNIADIRPLFRWMPLLLIFLVAALTMRQWSEEQKMGTLEILLTLPVPLSRLVLGKFVAVLALVAIALALTFGLPVSVSFMGDIDWGPVFGGYLGALLMASAYIAIGLFVSSRTDNQIIALIITVLLCGVFYLVGSPGITSFMGNEAGEFLRAFGTGSRFLSIERGVIDLRDMVYYGSLSAFFLLLNIVSLDHKRWSTGDNTTSYRRNRIVATVLVAANLLTANFWLDTVHSARIDLTENREYSISDPTRDLIGTLREPLLLRGYFSEKTHPLLAPLVSRIRDFMEEYGEASDGRITVEFVDPKYDEELEAEANQQYGIKPVPFQVSGRYEASVVNSYFNVLIKYGDQYVSLGFDDLIEVQRRKDGQPDVGLRNLEYDLTKSIKKVVYGFQGLATVFENINKDLKLTAVVTPKTLPEPLAEMSARINKVVGELQQEAAGKLTFRMINPDDPAGGYDRQAVNRMFGIEPLAVSLFSRNSFYLHLLLTVGDSSERIPLAPDMGEAEIRQAIEAGLKRTSAGFLKTVGLWTPQPQAPAPQMAMMQQPQEQYSIFQQVLRENYNLQRVDLTEGRAAADMDVLLLVAPQNLTDLERFAVDQYLMRGGSVVALGGRFVLDANPYSQTLQVRQAEKGIAELLAHYGVTVEESLVMDLQNEPFPIPVNRDLGGFVVQEIQQLDYPFFVDIRKGGMEQQSPVVANLSAVTLNWVSPLTIDLEKNRERTLLTLLRSSPDSWLHAGTSIQPDFSKHPRHGFGVGDALQSYPLAVSVQGKFASYFSDKEDPRDRKAGRSESGDGRKPDDAPAKQENSGRDTAISPVIKKSPSSSRLIVVGSSEFISDTVITIAQGMGQERFMNSLELLQNIIDWSVEDESLLAIRSRGAHARLLSPMTRAKQSFWEWLNYGIAILALIGVSVYGALRRRKEDPMTLEKAAVQED